MITGKELEEIAIKNCKTIRIGCHKDENGYNYPDTQDVYDWQAIAAEITPKPLTMEELITILDESLFPEEITGIKAYNGFIDVIGSLEADKLLDLINNKQKEQS